MSDSIDYCALGARIRHRREQQGLTQEQLGEACGLSTSFVGHIERGTRKLSVESLQRISFVLQIDADTLLSNKMTEETTLPNEISTLLQGSTAERLQRFWCAVRALAKHIDEL